MEKYTVIDLFAGAGGLSYGFLQTGRFQLVAAAEINKNAQATYKANIADKTPGFVFVDNVVGYDFAKLSNSFGGIDIVIGGPPCQGFSNANRQKNHLISMNNNRRAAHKDETLDECTIRLAAVSDLTAYDSEIQRVSDEITSLVEESKRLIEENARSPHNQEEYQHRHKALTERYNQACIQLTELQDQRNRCIDSQKSIEWFMDAFEHKEGLMESFDEEIFFSVLDYMTVYADGKVTVRFRDGAEVVIEGRKCR